MRIVTWNVNSIRTRHARCLALLERHRPDLLCLQETKVVDGDFPRADFEALGYHVEVHGQRTYNGVAILSREPLEQVQRGFPGDPAPGQARVLGGRTAGLRILDLYVPNGKEVGDEKYELKLRWLDALAAWIEEDWDPDEPAVAVGDFNIAPTDADVHDPEKWRGRVHCSEPERERLQRLLAWGFQDLHRLHRPDGGEFTWWDYRMGAFHRGWGLRIDLALGTTPVAGRLRSVTVDREERKPSSGEGKPSDHAPLLVDLAPAD